MHVLETGNHSAKNTIESDRKSCVESRKYSVQVLDVRQTLKQHLDYFDLPALSNTISPDFGVNVYENPKDLSRQHVLETNLKSSRQKTAKTL